MYIRINNTSLDVLKNTSILKKFNYTILLNLILIITFILNTSIYTYKGVNGIFWWNHLYLNNFNINLIFLIISISFFINLFIKNIKIENNINLSDYYFSLLNLIILIPIIFLSNSFYNFFFIIEVISVLIFYKFTVSRFWFKQIGGYNNKNTFENFFSKNYLNVLFYQYWVNFFSTVIILISLINIMYLYGSTEWILLNFITNINNNVMYFSNINFNYIFWFSILIGFFLKIGMTPTHLFKIEVYKGIPFLSIYFYTTFYFLSYFLFFSLLIFYQLNSLKIFWWFLLVIFLIIGIIYIITLLFDTNFTKAFFAYSTIANSLSFLCVIIAGL